MKKSTKIVVKKTLVSKVGVKKKTATGPYKVKITAGHFKVITGEAPARKARLVKKAPAKKSVSLKIKQNGTAVPKPPKKV